MSKSNAPRHPNAQGEMETDWFAKKRAKNRAARKASKLAKRKARK